MKRLRFIAWGAAFGFVLSRGRATDYDAISGMFSLRDPHLLLVIGGAVVIGAVVYRLVARWRASQGRPVNLGGAPVTASVLGGAAVFGLGWGLSGACPGTAFAQLGEGKVLALLTIAGMFAGTWLRAWASRVVVARGEARAAMETGGELAVTRARG